MIRIFNCLFAVLAVVFVANAAPTEARSKHLPSKSAAASSAAKAKAQKAAKSASRNKSSRSRKAPAVSRTLPPMPVPVAVASARSNDPAAVARDFDRWLAAIDPSGPIAGLAVALVKDDKVLLERGIGYTDWETREPVTVNTVFRLASLSKAFATATTALLVRDGVLRWDTRIADMLPTFELADQQSSQNLSVRDILSQRSGLPHNAYDSLLEQDEPYPLLIEKLKDVPMACQVGECYGYQNVAFSLIGDMTYAATGDFFYHQVEKRIFHPLAMGTATYGRDALESTASWARPHVRSGQGWRSLEPTDTYYHVAPAAGVNASIRDMEKWLIAQMGGRPDVLPLSLLTTLHEPQVETQRELRGSPWKRSRLLDAHYALGWRVFDYAGETMVFHAGAVRGYRGMLAFLPKYRFGL
ncbi:MAG: serine hydrolase domain-containing protein, partial [Dokdonella sp.]